MTLLRYCLRSASHPYRTKMIACALKIYQPMLMKNTTRSRLQVVFYIALILLRSVDFTARSAPKWR